MTGEGSTDSGRAGPEIREPVKDEPAAPADTARSAPHKPDGQTAGSKKRPAALLGGALVIVLLIGGGIYYWLSTRNIESTDDAYTDGRANYHCAAGARHRCIP